MTNIDGFDRLAVQSRDGRTVADGKFVVISDNARSRQRFSWEVKAVRADVAPLVVEPRKDEYDVRGLGPYTYATKKSSQVAPERSSIAGPKSVESMLSEKSREIEKLKEIVCQLRPDAEICGQ